MNLRHIVVATDDSEAGCHAVRGGLDLAARADARLTVMRAVPARAVPLMGATVGRSSEVQLEDADTARERLAHWLADGVIGEDAAVPVALGIAVGVPAIEICRFVEHGAADLLVLGRKRRSVMARLLMGDTADAVVRRSLVPSLFLQPGSGPIREMLVALDGTERGMRVLGVACGFARAVGASIRVVTVEDREPASEPHQTLPTTRSSRLQREVGAKLARRPGPRLAGETGVTVRRGPVVREVLAELAERETHVLAFGYHRGGPPGFIEGGSTARQLLHTAPASVLAIPL
jgi:nucleotide-binding universal stress UspA family protein